MVELLMKKECEYLGNSSLNKKIFFVSKNANKDSLHKLLFMFTDEQAANNRLVAIKQLCDKYNYNFE